MSEYLNATCAICGTKYHICNDCQNTRAFTPWRTIADSINCYKIYLILRDYTNGNSDAATTKEQLLMCDLSDVETFQDNIKVAIEKLMAPPKIRKKAVKKVESESKIEVEKNDE